MIYTQAEAKEELLALIPQGTKVYTIERNSTGSYFYLDLFVLRIDAKHMDGELVKITEMVIALMPGASRDKKTFALKYAYNARILIQELDIMLFGDERTANGGSVQHIKHGEL